MKELVLLKNDEAFTNSLIIAEGAGIEHRALIQLISSHIDDVCLSLEGSHLKCYPLKPTAVLKK